MIRLSKLTDYGFVLLTQFTIHGAEQVLTARDIAGEVRVPAPTVSKLLKAMAKGGLLTAHRGAKGGYSLARQPEQITVADVINALEGPIGMTECSTSEICDIGGNCPNKSNWRRINDAVFSALKRITLADMVPGGKFAEACLAKSCGCGPHCITPQEATNPADACSCECHVDITEFLTQSRVRNGHTSAPQATDNSHSRKAPQELPAMKPGMPGVLKERAL